GVGRVDRVRRLGGAEGPHLPDAAPGLETVRPVAELVGEDPSVPRVPYGVHDRPADRDVVGLVEVPSAPRVAEVAGDDDIGPVPTDLGGDHAAQRDAVLQHTVGLPEEVHDVDPDDLGRADLLRLADLAARVRSETVDAGLTA